MAKHKFTAGDKAFWIRDDNSLSLSVVFIEDIYKDTDGPCYDVWINEDESFTGLPESEISSLDEAIELVKTVWEREEEDLINQIIG